MILYHGTTAEVAEMAIRQGIKPRIATGKSNWKHTITSNPSMVYLTSIYAPYFAICAASEDQRLGIIEIETDKLDPKWMRPDEDFIEQAFRMSPQYDIIPVKGIKNRTKYVRNNIDKFQDLWTKSVEFMGNCAYKGVIPTTAITRVVTVDRNNPSMEFNALDPIICIENFRLCKEQYQLLTKWFLGDPVSFEEWIKVKHLDLFMQNEELKETFEPLKLILQNQSGIKEIFALTKP
jgi:hypothetical protein